MLANLTLQALLQFEQEKALPQALDTMVLKIAVRSPRRLDVEQQNQLNTVECAPMPVSRGRRPTLCQHGGVHRLNRFREAIRDSQQPQSYHDGYLANPNVASPSVPDWREPLTGH